VQKNYIVEPDRYFKLEITIHQDIQQGMNHLIPHLGRIYRGAEWEDLELWPYNFEEKLDDGTTAYGFGSFEINQRYFCFQPMLNLDKNILRAPLFKEELIESKEWAAAIEHKKRHVNVPNQVYILRLLSVPYDEISNLTEFYRLYTEGRLAIDCKDYTAAISCFKLALELTPNDVECTQLYSEARVKSKDLAVIKDGLAFYANDMDSAIHCGAAVSWLRLAIGSGKDYHLALNLTLRVIFGVEELIASKIDKTKRVYSGYSICFCKRKRDDFIKRLGTLRGFLSTNLVEANLDRPEELRMLLTRIAKVNPTKADKINQLQKFLSSQL
jgi:tetratricopeptide (TPR) repeat protein